MQRPDPQKDSPWKAAALVSAIGVDLVICMFAGYWIGTRLQDWFGGQAIWIVVGIILGFFIGVISVIFLLRNYMGGSSE